MLWGESLITLLEKKEEFKVMSLVSYSQLTKKEFQKTLIYIVEASSPNAELVRVVKLLKNNNQKVIVVGFVMDNQFVDMIFQYGIDGYVLKTDSKENLYLSINQACRGEKFFSAYVTEILSKHLISTSDDSKLTARELEVLIGIVNMQQTHQIAKNLHLSEATVRTHRKNIIRKFGAKNYIGMIRYACSNGLLESPGEQFCSGCQKERCISKQNG